MSNDDSFDVGKYTIPKSDQINAEDFLAGPKTYTVRHVREKGGTEQPVEIFLDEVDRPWRPCKTSMRVLAYGWGPQTGAWKGRQATLYRDPSVKWGGAEVGGIRVKAMSDLQGELARGFVLALSKSKGTKGNVEIAPIRRAGQTKPAPEPDPQDEPPALPPEIHAKAELAARQGSVTFREWWRSDEAKAHRAGLTRNLTQYQAIASDADAKGAPDRPDPFDQGAPDDPALADDPRDGER